MLSAERGCAAEMVGRGSVGSVGSERTVERDGGIEEERDASLMEIA